MEDKSLTPMMQQYVNLKRENEDSLLFYRLGDFYELFYEDAVIASKVLGLVLTKRHDIPMCGVPWHSHESYLTKLIQNGYRVAICEQLETPEEAKKKRGYKATVERGIVRVVTKGTLIESSMLKDTSNNFLLAISGISGDKIGIAYADISTGNFLVEEIEISGLLSAISKVAPSEIICQDNLLSKKDILDSIEPYKSIIRAIPSAKFLRDSSEKRLADFFNVKFIDAFGKFSKNVVEAAAAIVEYIFDVYVSNKVNLSFPKLVNHSDYMQLDSFTRKSLELTRTQSGETKGSLLDTIDETVTSGGARLLGSWLMQPLINADKINKRLDFVEFFFNKKEFCNNVRSTLKEFPDLERSIARIIMNKAGPRDLNCVKIALKKARELNAFIMQFEELKSLDIIFHNLDSLINELELALCDDVPVLARDGGFIKTGYDSELDEHLDLLNNGEYVIQKLQKKYIEETGITTLKIKNNNVIGYFIDVSPNHISKIPFTFTHRQTLASSIRYATPELSDIANKIYSADSNAKQRELFLFEEISNKIIKEKDNIKNLANKISFLDVISSFAYFSIENNYIRPKIVEEKIMNIKNGRHPVVEKGLKSVGNKFIANDVLINEDKVASILTGPNMGGKSTYLRQNAIIIILSQMGMFVPAEDAVIGIADKIFSRVGASDDISSGKSTFMVEMLETAAILCQATEKSFVILDEIGRGTSTYDGLAIAWAVVEEIANNIKARTIFATHYHELIRLKEILNNIHFLTVKVQEWNNQIVFLHKIEDGFVDKSYGIHVAALAGFPKRVLKNAEEVLRNIVKVL